MKVAAEGSGWAPQRNTSRRDKEGPRPRQLREVGREGNRPAYSTLSASLGLVCEQTGGFVTPCPQSVTAFIASPETCFEQGLGDLTSELKRAHMMGFQSLEWKNLIVDELPDLRR